MTALVSMGTGLVSMVLRLLSSLCHDTEGRGSPDAWHSRLMGSPTLTRTGPAGVTTATGESGDTETETAARGRCPTAGGSLENFVPACFTFHDQRHDAVGDAERVAGHAAVRTLVLRLDAHDGDDGTVMAQFDVI